MSMPTKLSEKHWQALELLSKDIPRKDVAEKMGWKRNYLDQLCIGAVTSAGGVAGLFKSEYEKVKAKSKKETDDLIHGNLKAAQKLMKEVFDEIGGKKKKSDADKKILSMYTNAIAKCQPSVNIKNLSYSYTKGLNAEELVHEFKRLKTIAEGSFDRGQIRKEDE